MSQPTDGTEGSVGVDRTTSERSDLIRAWVVAHEAEIVELAAAFIAIPSENRPPRGAERDFQIRLAQELRQLGMDVDEFLITDVDGLTDHSLFWPGREYADRPNIIGRLAGAGEGRSLLLAGHADVVTGVPGRHPPFEPVVTDGRLYGRGSNDMKGGIAAAVMAVRCLRELGVDLQGDVLIESVVDEEMGGANGTLANRLVGYNPDAAVIMEPSNMRICPAHLGGRVYRVSIEGTGGMGFGGMEIVNPAYAMARLVVALERFADARRDQPAPSVDLDPGRGLDTVLSIANSGSFAPGQGTGVPGDAVIEVWAEAFPGTTEADLDAAFFGFCREVVAADSVLSKCPVKYERVTRFLPGSSIDTNHPIVSTATEAMTRIVGSDRVSVGAAPFACDAFVFNEFGVPVVIVGPTGDNAHAADEYVTCASLVDLTATLAIMLVAWCGPQQPRQGADSRRP